MESRVADIVHYCQRMIEKLPGDKDGRTVVCKVIKLKVSPSGNGRYLAELDCRGSETNYPRD